MFRRSILIAPVLLGAWTGCHPLAQPVALDPQALPDRWRTRAERTDYAETARYTETVAFCRQLAANSPHAHYTTFGTSGEGRPLPLLILSSERAFTPAAARRSDKVCFLVINCIHAGECMGKDASLELARDILLTRPPAHLLDHVNLLIIPIFNVDGHERFGAYNRINQNGPNEMGWRVNATNLNLNRDFAKADAVEMQAWLQLWNTWNPDLLFDQHSTDGMDHRYDLFYAATTGPVIATPLSDWVETRLLARVLPAMADAGFNVMPYSWPRDESDLTKGIEAAGAFGARYSTGFAAVCNRPAVLVEAHACKPYKIRVRSTYELMLNTLGALNADPLALRQAIARADALATETRGGELDGRVPIRLQATDQATPMTFKGVKTLRQPSGITGGEVFVYTNEPCDVPTQLYEKETVAETVTPTAAYLIPPQWTEVTRRLELHGVESFRLRTPATLDVESYRFENVRFASTPYEGRQSPIYDAVPVRQRREFVAGTVVVPTDQPRAKLIAHLLEPAAADSLLAWGLFNAIFEQKEYFEAYVMEPIARRMLAEDAALRTEFEQKLAADADFAASPRRRLHFFYERSPYYDTRHNLYPVARLTDPAAVARLRGQ